MSHGGLKRARNWKRWIRPKNTYSSPGLLYSEFRCLCAHSRISESLSRYAIAAWHLEHFGRCFRNAGVMFMRLKGRQG
jgi:hypothetical protein